MSPRLAVYFEIWQPRSPRPAAGSGMSCSPRGEGEILSSGRDREMHGERRLRVRAGVAALRESVIAQARPMDRGYDRRAEVQVASAGQDKRTKARHQARPLDLDEQSRR